MFFFSIKVDGAFDPGDGFSPVKCRFAYHFIINWLLYYYDVIRARRLTPWCKTPSMDFNWWIILTLNLTAFSSYLTFAFYRQVKTERAASSLSHGIAVELVSLDFFLAFYISMMTST